MKKIIDKIIDKRYIILFLFILFAIFCAILTKNANINYEISNYLPSDSKVKQGLNIMEDKFKQETSSFNIMFKDLTKEEEETIKNTLENFEGVDSISYDDSENYHKDNYTLYTVTVTGDADSKEASKTYQNIINEFEDYELSTSGDIVSRNTEVLPFYVLVAAVACGTVILIIMCDSVVEVFLFLFTILIAVLLNKGTNIIFSSVSNITDSISAILQLALSMDYSIMLMNRYNQEKEKFKNNSDAMKNALYYSFKSISSSSITTVVGLLALVFMSFTIGKDLGFVLAKGVIFSLISTFFVLPGLILIFDKWITKTKKKVPTVSFDKIASFNYKFRYLFLILFIILFVASFLLKGNLKTYFIDESNDEIATIFKEDNQIAIIYNNKDEDKISDYCKTLKNNKDLNNVVCYGNTISEKLTYNDINNKLKDLNVNTNIDEYLLKLIYYKYNTDETNKISFNDFVSFINNTIDKNNDIDITSSLKEQITNLSYFANKDTINKNRTSKELANILDIDESLMDNLIIYYNSLNSDKISLKDFIFFMKTNVINDSSYNIDDDTKDNLNYLYNIISNLDNSYNSEELSNILGISKVDIDKLMIYYVNTLEINTTLDINTFTNIIINNYTYFKDYISYDTYNNILIINKFSNKDFINNEMNSSDLSLLFGIDESVINTILSSLNKDLLSPLDLTKFILNNNLITDQNTISKLTLINSIMDSTQNNEVYNYKDLSNILDIDSSSIKLIYAYNDSINYKLSPRNFIEIVTSNNLINNSNLIKLNTIINNLDNKLTSSELSNILNIDNEKIKLIYGLYDFKNNSNTISINNLIKFICSDVINNKEYSSNFSESSINKLNGLNDILLSVNNDEKLSSKEMVQKLQKLDTIDSSSIEIIYIYYGSVNEYDDKWTMSIEEIIDYLNNNILKDSRFDGYIKDDIKKEITEAKETINDAKELLVGEDYSRMIITSKLDVEGTEVKKLIEEINDDLKDTEAYVVGSSSMANEMDETFSGELNLITILTMIFIFVVVAVTFKSIIIPIVLVLTIQCAVFTTMGILSLIGGNVYFVSLLIVQAILMGATIDYAIVYTSYYLESRKTKEIKEAMKEAYSNSSHTIITSSLILSICTIVVAIFTNASASKICETISEGTICSTILILFVLPGVIASLDKLVRKKQKNM